MAHMCRVTFRIWLALLLAVSPLGVAQTEASTPEPVYDNAEAYKVYDGLFRYMGENQHLHGDKLAILASTIRVEDMPLGVCGAKLADLPTEPFSDLKEQNTHTWRLQPRIPVGRNYELIQPFDSRVELEGVVSNVSPEDEARAPKPEFQGDWQLSAVGFNKVRNLAVVLTFYTCGISCGFGGPFVLSKHGEAWQVDQWVCQIVS
jgi:hypothetical protein